MKTRNWSFLLFRGIWVISCSAVIIYGTLHSPLFKNNSKVADPLRNLYADIFDNYKTEECSYQQHKTKIFDGMVLVNKLKIKRSNIKNCCEYANAFINMVMDEADNCDEIRVVFWLLKWKVIESTNAYRLSRWNWNSLPRDKWDTNWPSYYKKRYFIKTKDEMTVFLCQKLADVLTLKLSVMLVCIEIHVSIENLTLLKWKCIIKEKETLWLCFMH